GGLRRCGRATTVGQCCERGLSQGYTAVKLHEVADAAVAAAREVVPTEIPLMLDRNCEWQRDDAVRMAQRFERHHLHWLEEPVFPPEDFAALRAVGESSGIATAAGENLCFATQFAALVASQAVKFAQPSVTKVGGVTEF